MLEMEEEDGDRVHALTFLQHCSQMHRIPPETLQVPVLQTQNKGLGWKPDVHK